MFQNWLNPKRLRDYPRLFLIAGWTVIILNVVLRQGWIGGLTGILIGGDFIPYYAGGVLYRQDAAHLYNPDSQQEIQSELVAPSQPAGFAPFISPPYVALIMSWLSFVPLGWMLGAWTVTNLGCTVLALYLMDIYILPEWLKQRNLTTAQLGIIALSSFAFIDGFQAGQNHGMTLLIVIGIVLSTMRKRWTLAGIFAGLLIYKPQFVIGFLILWLVWGKWRALLTFGVISLLCIGMVVITAGFSPWIDYLDLSRYLVNLPYAKDSFPVSVMSTPYALAATLLPGNWAGAVKIAYSILTILLSGSLAIIAYRSRNMDPSHHKPVLALTLLFPLLTAPHALLYDLIILVPAFLMLGENPHGAPGLKNLAILSYLGTLALPLLGYPVKLALPALIPLAFYITQFNRFYFPSKAQG